MSATRPGQLLRRLAPPDPDDALAAMAARLAGQWLSGPRERVPSPGPVPSNRFT